MLITGRSGYKVKSNEEIIKAIESWQANDWVHPLTCGNNSLHENLIPVVQDGTIVLKCTDCDYVQTYIPEMFLK